MNACPRQPTSHASVIGVFKGQTEHLKPMIYLPVTCDFISKPQTFYCKEESYTTAFWIEFLEL